MWHYALLERDAGETARAAEKASGTLHDQAFVESRSAQARRVPGKQAGRSERGILRRLRISHPRGLDESLGILLPFLHSHFP